MASKAISWSGIGIRFLFALVLVLTTYNPTGMSYVSWVFDESGFRVEKLFLGIVLIIGWAIFVRATARSLGVWGFLLTTAFFGTFLWLIIHYFNINLENVKLLTWIGLIIMSAILTTGISWSHIRRRLTGQVDVDEVEGGGHDDH